MNLSTRSHYGTRAMVELARLSPEGPVSLVEIARNQKIPQRYLAKIIQNLRRAGFVKSVRGANGGYLLARDPSKIEVLDIVRCLDGAKAPVRCIDNAGSCDRSSLCATRDVWARLNDAMLSVLASVTLQDLLDRSGSHALARRHKQRV